jgi:hypothetical protein
MSEKWELYHQGGPDGLEWGVRVRPGYVLTGFTREDAEAVVARQNAAVSRPAGDILERAKAEYEIADDDIVDLLRELIADVEAHRARDLILCAIIKEREAEVEKYLDYYHQEQITASLHYQNLGIYKEKAESLEKEVERLRSAPKSGLYGKYIIQKADGAPVDPHADYFVLRLDTDPYARIAALEYAIQTDDQTLGEMLEKRVMDHVFSEDDQCRKRAEAWPLGMIEKLRGEVERLRSREGPRGAGENQER